MSALKLTSALAGVTALALTLGCERDPSSFDVADQLTVGLSLGGEGCTNVAGDITANFLEGWAPGPGPDGDPVEAGPDDPQTDIVGQVFGDVRGDAFAKIHNIREGEDGTLHIELRHTYVVRNAADEEEGRVHTIDRGVLDPVDPPEYRFNNQLEVTGGSGLFADASGRLHAHGKVDFGTGEIEIDYRGRVCTFSI